MDQSGDWEKIQSSIYSFQIGSSVEAEIGAQQRTYREQNNYTSEIKNKYHGVPEN